MICWRYNRLLLIGMNNVATDSFCKVTVSIEMTSEYDQNDILLMLTLGQHECVVDGMSILLSQQW